MTASLSSFSQEQVAGVLVVATVIAVVTWFSTDMSGASRITTTVVAWFLGGALTAAGLWALS